MKSLYRILIAVLALQFISLAGFAKKPAKVLIFSITKGYRHKSIGDGISAIKKLGEKNSFLADTTENPAAFTAKNLKRYKAIVFLSPTGDDFFTDSQKKAFQDYIHTGGGFVGIHAATDCLFNWEWYGKLVGAYFINHPKIQQASLNILDGGHAATRGLPNPWIHTDEWYNFKSINPSIKVLINLDEGSYTGGTNGSSHPIAWYHDFEGGRVFYTGLGHTAEAYSDEMFLKHLLGGIKYAMGL